MWARDAMITADVGSAKPPTRAGAGPAMSHVALLRGINVGGRARVPMDRLREVFVEAGCTEVVTYIQSGNVVFRPPPGVLGGALSSTLQERIDTTFGVSAAVVIRTAAEWADLVQRNPFVGVGVDPMTLHVMLLADEAAPDDIARLDPDRSPPDEFVVDGREVYLHHPNGSRRSKLTIDYFERKLHTVATARNWNTATKLAELLCQ